MRKSMKRVVCIILMCIFIAPVYAIGESNNRYIAQLAYNYKQSISQWLATNESRAILTALLYLDCPVFPDQFYVDIAATSYVGKSSSDKLLWVVCQSKDHPNGYASIAYDPETGAAYYFIEDIEGYTSAELSKMYIEFSCPDEHYVNNATKLLEALQKLLGK